MAKGKTKRRPLKRARQVRERLEQAIPKIRVELDFDSAWQLLIATILAAQSTDKMVNSVTPELFERWPTPKALGEAPQEEVEEVVHSTGFFRNKAKAIIGASRKIADEFGGEVPRTLDEVTTLPGVARKTGNVVLGSAYGIPSGIVVDTHVTRVSNRLRLTGEKNAKKIEADLCDLYDEAHWIGMSHRLVLHGRYVCKAKSPRCSACPLNECCPGREAQPDDEDWTLRAAWERDEVGVDGPGVKLDV